MALIYKGAGREAYYTLSVKDLERILKPSIKDLIMRAIIRHRQVRQRGAYTNYLFLVSMALLTSLLFGGLSTLSVAIGAIAVGAVAYDLSLIAREYKSSKKSPLNPLHQDQIEKLSLIPDGHRFDVESMEWKLLITALKWKSKKRYIAEYATVNTFRDSLNPNHPDMKVKRIVDRYLNATKLQRGSNRSYDHSYDLQDLAFAAAVDVFKVIDDDIDIDHLDISSLHFESATGRMKPRHTAN